MRLSTTVYLAHSPGRRIAASDTLLLSDKDTLVSVDTTAGIVILGMPSNPTVNDTYYLIDANGTWSARNVVLSNALYNGVMDSYALDISGGVVSVAWRGSAIGWTVGLDAPVIDNSVLNQLLANKVGLQSPAFTGMPTAPTGTANSATTQIATQAYVDRAVTTETSRATAAEALKAPLLSPSLQGAPTTVTPLSTSNGAEIPNTSWTRSRIAESAAKAALTANLATPITANTTLSNTAEGTILALNSTASSFTVTMPSNPTTDGVYGFVDVHNSWGINPVTIALLGGKYHGRVDGDIILDVSASTVMLKYTGATYGWIQLT
jgi:hypothetical protein